MIYYRKNGKNYNSSGENIPKISVVMPIYKGDKYLSEAVDSILNQTFSDFEFIIICDDPSDETRYLLDKYRQKDSRMKVHYQEKQGLVNSLNKGISLSKGEYIVRMDADDISLPNRLIKQVKFMDENPEVGISGTAVKTFGDELHVWKYPCDHDTIVCNMLFQCSIAHPTVIVRKSIFCQNRFSYHENESYAEDYGLWIRTAKVTKLANIPDILLYYRFHASNTNRHAQKDMSDEMRLSQIRQLGISPTKLESEIHEAISDFRYEKSEEFIHSAKSWLEKLQAANSKMSIYPEPAFSKVLANNWYYVCCNSGYSGVNSWNLFYKCNLSKSANILYTQKAVLLLKPVLTSLGALPRT